jgi:hypothetical protein
LPSPNKILYETCSQCNKRVQIIVKTVDWENWTHHNIKAQDAFPYLSARQMKILIMHICGECFGALFRKKFESSCPQCGAKFDVIGTTATDKMDQVVQYGQSFHCSKCKCMSVLTEHGLIPIKAEEKHNG